ncbi:hypothetical protein DFH07DRAFT_958296 [Mycena maculata]|uniref:Uncharacterized protein n=1 Tax=Mycena maculata TaxID=230809 RepID=A0AAD7J6W7_9AGAR|nr:hypothetical protein DFH07DRAFT_958296 [Mycena maculata]
MAEHAEEYWRRRIEESLLMQERVRRVDCAIAWYTEALQNPALPPETRGAFDHMIVRLHAARDGYIRFAFPLCYDNACIRNKFNTSKTNSPIVPSRPISPVPEEGTVGDEASLEFKRGRCYFVPGETNLMGRFAEIIKLGTQGPISQQARDWLKTQAVGTVSKAESEPGALVTPEQTQAQVDYLTKLRGEVLAKQAARKANRAADNFTMGRIGN